MPLANKRKVRTPNEQGTLEELVSTKGGVSLWKVSQKITALHFIMVGKGENVW